MPTDPAAKTKKTSREEQAERTRAHILQTALHLFAKRGVSATSTRRIAKEAGVSEGLIFHHFPKKRDLLAGITQGRGILAEQIVQLMANASEMPVEVAVRAIATRFVDFLGSRTVEARLFQIMICQSRTDPEMGEVFVATAGRVIAAIGGYLRSRIDAGELRPDLGCEAAARGLMGSFFFFYVSTRHETEEAWREAATAYTEQVVEVWLRGALVSPGAAASE